MRYKILFIAFSCIFILTACSKSVVVATDFPRPVMEPMPLKVGVRYTDSLREYVHEQKNPLEPGWSIDIGAANIRLFDALFGGMFREISVLNESEDGDVTLDAIIEPVMENFEYSLPDHSGSDQYAVWIRYQIRVIAPDGELIANLPVKAYGQATEQMLDSEESMEMATIIAMRDAAATIAAEFSSDATIRSGLLTPELEEES
ncbi:MAG: hypothetical protein ACR2P6_01270 [Gammaproteobacteria bacterium]